MSVEGGTRARIHVLILNTKIFPPCLPSHFQFTFILMDNCIHSKHSLQQPRHRLRGTLLHPTKDEPIILCCGLGLVPTMFFKSTFLIMALISLIEMSYLWGSLLIRLGSSRTRNAFFFFSCWPHKSS